MIVKLLTERHLEFLSLKGGCTGSSESTLAKMSNCWKSHALAHLLTSTNLVQNSVKRMHGEKTYLYSLCISEKENKDQESIQSSTRPGPGYHMGK